MIAGTLIDGHILLADWLLLIAAVIFVVAAVVAYIRQPPPRRDIVAPMVPLGLALVATALLVL
jgi:hypothetical protein